jgi:cytochrome c553
MALTVRITWGRVLLGLAGLALAGLAVAWSGIVNIGASTGHWAITSWFLHWSMGNTVRTWSLLTVDDAYVAAMDREHLVAAAGHFAAQCSVCHGAPGEPPSPVMRAATPAAPDLASSEGKWQDRELFWIIRHGVKYTPMPAWPAGERLDEIRGMVALVRSLPGMTEDTWRELAYGGDATAATGRVVRIDDALQDCERCHADDGRGQPDIPVLAGQKASYLVAALEAFAEGRRPSGVMGAAASRVDPALFPALAEHYAGQARRARPQDATGTDQSMSLPAAARSTDDGSEPRQLAARIAEEGLPEVRLPACLSCHGSGDLPPGLSPDLPRDAPVLEGQKATYLAKRLRGWRGDPKVVEARKSTDTMAMIARRIPDDLIEPLARHFAAKSPAENR